MKKRLFVFVLAVVMCFSALSVVAFAEGEHNITVSIGTGGGGTVAPSATTAAKDATITLTVTPNDRYVVESVTVTGTTIGTTTLSAPYSFTMPDEDVTVTATFKKLTYYTVNFDGNGAWSGSTDTIYPDFDTDWKLPYNGFYKAGYHFNGWCTNKDGGGNWYWPNGTIKNLGRAENNYTVTMYAMWAPNDDKYTIVYDGNGAEEGEMEDQTGLSIGQWYQLQANEYKKDGYHFVGWSTTKDSYIAYWDQNSVFDLNLYGGTVTLYAKWEENVYTTYYNGNYGSVKENGSIKYTITDEAHKHMPEKLLENTFERKGYEFLGWSLKASDKEITEELTPEKLFENSYYANVYAIWKLVNYNITYETNGGTLGDNPQTTYTINSGATYKSATREGYTFGGWYSEPELTNRVYGVYAGNVGDRTVYAKWTPVRYNIYYNYGAGQMEQGVTNLNYYNIETESTELNAPVKRGYTFAGWYDNPSFTGEPVESIGGGQTGVLHLYAKWTPTEYTINADYDGGTIKSGNEIPESYNIAQQFHVQLPTLEKEGYKFEGWYEKDGTTRIQTILKTAAKDYEIYAKFTEIAQ